LVFDNQLILIDIKNINQPTLNLDALKGKTFTQVIIRLNTLLIPKNAAKLNKAPVIIGFGSDVIAPEQVALIKNSIASALKSSPVLVMGLSKTQTTQVMDMGANYLNKLNKATLEMFIGFKPLTEARYQSVIQNERLMTVVGNLSKEITYKPANKTVFDENSKAITNKTKHSDDDDNDDEDDDDDDDHNDSDKDDDHSDEDSHKSSDENDGSHDD